jgi:hypothetical protein
MRSIFRWLQSVATRLFSRSQRVAKLDEVFADLDRESEQLVAELVKDYEKSRYANGRFANSI